jgi:hypothetical protein
MAGRGGRRPRRYVIGDQVPVWVSSGRWGPRRVRVEQCVTLTAEIVYHQALCAREPIGPGSRLTLTWRPHDSSFSWQIDAEVIPNAVWRCGRLFLRCCGCRSRATRLYVPLAGLEPRCRRCWGLSYESQSWSYHGGWLAGVLGPIAHATTFERRRERQEASRQRYTVRRSLTMNGT